MTEYEPATESVKAGAVLWKGGDALQAKAVGATYLSSLIV